MQLGDATFAFRSTFPDDSGAPFEGTYLYWQHRALVLSVRMIGPAGSTSMDQVVALAKQLEAQFQANPVPTSGLPDLAGAPTPAPTSTAGPPRLPAGLAAGPAFALSPEEAVIAILPYQLSAADAPSGYTVGRASSLSTPVTLAAADPTLSIRRLRRFRRL